MPNTSPDERGAAVVAALMAMLVLAAMGAMLSLTVAEEAMVARNHHETTRCLYVCEAGLNYAMVKLAADPAWPGLPWPGRAVGGGAFAVAVTDSSAQGVPLPAGQLRVNVVARIGDTEREIEVLVQ